MSPRSHQPGTLLLLTGRRPAGLGRPEGVGPHETFGRRVLFFGGRETGERRDGFSVGLLAVVVVAFEQNGFAFKVLFVGLE